MDRHFSFDALGLDPVVYEGTLEAFQIPSVLSEDQPFGVVSPLPHSV